MGVESKEEMLKLSVPDAIEQFKTNLKQGLSSEEAAIRLVEHGPNMIEEKRSSIWKELFLYFWGPIPWMIEIAAILAALLRDWPDFIMITLLLLINSGLGFFHEYQASSALEALKNRLALRSRVLRDGEWKEIEASALVPGDIVSVKIGNIIPADVKLLTGEYLSVDQSSLTGESLPIGKEVGEVAYSGTIVKKGEMVALVMQTGMKTFFGKTAQLVSEAKVKSILVEAIRMMGHFLVSSTLGVAVIILIVSLYRIETHPHMHEELSGLLVFLLVLVVAGIPVALPAVMSVTLGLGSHALSKLKAIVSKLMAIEALAGINVLCADKTGTLTKNQLTVGKLFPYKEISEEDLLFTACLASTTDESDAIDKAIMNFYPHKEKLKDYTCERFIPFDPVRKRTEASVTKQGGKPLIVSKGAPQILVRMTTLSEEDKQEVLGQIVAFASRGFRTIGVARSEDNGSTWHFLGLIPLSDPPRDDTVNTIQRLKDLGVKVQMVTGDHVAIARELGKELQLGTHIVTAEELDNPALTSEERDALVASADGYAQVFPEHKFEIVKDLQHKKNIVGMTGDGVNDAPALKQANAGIAVSGATDAARAAADLVLTESGLMVICHAIEEGRRIFARLKSYAMFRISETYRLIFFLLASLLVFNSQPLSAVMIILIALLNDIPLMMIAYDHMEVAKKPVTWNMKEVFTLAIGLSIVGVISTFGLYWIGERYWHLSAAQCRTLAFLAINCGGNLTIFITRNRGSLWQKPAPELKFFLATIFTQIVGTFVAVYGFGSENMQGIGWTYALYSWVYILVWFFLCSLTKKALYVFLDGGKRAYILERELTLDLSSLGFQKGVRLRVQVEREQSSSTD
jgi:H+-transporting ATPase